MGRDDINLAAAFDYARETLKGLQLLNGGGAVAILTFYGNYVSKVGVTVSLNSAHHIACGLVSFAVGALSAVLSFMCAYFCQYCWGAVFKDKNGNEGPNEVGALWSQICGLVFALLSAFAFVIGVYQASAGLEALK